MAIPDPKTPTRAEIAKIASNDAYMIKAIERLFEQGGFLLAEQIEDQTSGLRGLRGQINEIKKRLDDLEDRQRGS